MDIKNLLLKQYALYPRMQSQDIVKLLYQNEFAGGHFIADERASLQRLQEECGTARRHTAVEPGAGCLFEDIGNHLCRLHLAALRNTGIRLSTINRFFIQTADEIRGSIQSFEEKLAVLRQCCREGDMPYPLGELDAYLQGYQGQGYPPVGHSGAYRAAYSPAYRIVKSVYRDFFELFCRIDRLTELQEAVYVAIDGNSGAGKSTLAALLGNIYDCNIFHMDDFFLPPELKTQARLKEVGGNVDYARFYEEVIRGLQSGRSFEYQAYDCMAMALGQWKRAAPKRLHVIEGSYSMHPILAGSYHLKVFLRLREEEQSRRILMRNGPALHKRFLNEWIPKENQYFQEMRIAEQCDLVFER